MKLSRRNFLKVFGGIVASCAVPIKSLKAYNGGPVKQELTQNEETISEISRVDNFKIDNSGYSLVRFAPKRKQNEPNEICLSFNGSAMVIKRDVDIIIPNSYLEVADNCVRMVYNRRGGKQKKVGYRFTFPYRKIRTSSYEEFKSQTIYQ